MEGHDLYKDYTSLTLPKTDYTGSRTRRNFLRELSPKDITSLNNHVVRIILEHGQISELQAQVLGDIDAVLMDERFEGKIREKGSASMIGHSYGITIHGNYLGPKRYTGYRTVVKLEVSDTP